MSNILSENRLSIARCREILNTNGQNYTDEEIIAIRDFLYAFAGWADEHHNHQEDSKVLPFIPDINTQHEERA